MHGIVHKALKEYVEEDIDGVDWDSATERAGLDPKLYLPVTHYPDNEITRAVTALSELSGRTENSIQRAFGQSLAPQLLDTFKAHVRDEWGAQEVLLALDTIYEQLEADNGESASTTVSTRAEGEAVVLTYRSERELCTVLRGIAVGVAAEYDATTMIDESTCLREGDDRCELRVDLD
jgi:hypothetical protein